MLLRRFQYRKFGQRKPPHPLEGGPIPYSDVYDGLVAVNELGQPIPSFEDQTMCWLIGNDRLAHRLVEIKFVVKVWGDV